MYRMALILLSIIVFSLPISPGHAATEWSPLMRAAFYGDLNSVKSLLDAGAYVNVKDDEGSTPLMVAASQGHIAIVRELLARGAEVNVQNNYGWTPLMLATTARRAEIVKLLLARGSDPNIKNRDGKTALIIAQGVGLAELFASVERKPERQPTVQERQPTVQERQVAEPERQRVQETPQSRRQDEIRRLLAQAERQLKAVRLTSPTGDNAYESYQKVLELDPDNTEAKAGLERIAGQYEQWAQRRKNEGALDRSLSYIERGLLVQPRHAGLAALQQEVQSQLAAQQRQRAEQESQLVEQESQRREIDRLLAQAKRQLDALRLTLPAGDNAYESYQKVLELDPDNAEAQAGLSRIATEYERMAQQSREQETLQASLSYIERGLEVQPSHEGLLALQEAVQVQLAEQERQRAEQERQRQEIEHLLAEAEQQFKARRLMQPEGDNALESYRKVLEIDPDHAGARAGLEKIVAEYERLARQHQEEGALQESLAAIEDGLQVQHVQPAHEGLLALQEAVQAQLAEQERQRAERERQLAEQERKRQEIERLLAQAEQQLKDWRLMQPEGDNAYESYQKVLEIDPDNTQAKAGLARIAGEYERLAQQHQKEGALQESLAAIEEGLQVQPAHEGLLALQEAVQAQLAEQERQRAERERKRQEIERLLAQAEQQFKDRRLVQPAGDNAFESYRKVLEIESNNAEAKAGLARIAGEYERLAGQHKDKGDLPESLAAIETGLQVQPAHEGLLALQEAVQAQLAERERQLAEQKRKRQEIERLLAQAEQQFKDRRLMQPEGDNAYESYRKVLEIDPDNTQAKAGLARIAGEYERLARQHQEEGALQKSLATIEDGLQVQPAHEGLLALQEAVQAQLAEQERQRAERERQRQEIERLLAEAEQHLKDRRLTQPAGDNAYESYQKVLELEPDNAKAKAGIERLLAQAEQILREKLSALRQIEQELDAEEQSMRLSIQRALAEEWKPRPGSSGAIQ